MSTARVGRVLRAAPAGPARRAAPLLLLLVVGLAGALWLATPWDPLPGAPAAGAGTGAGTELPVAPLRDFTRAEVAREDAFHAAVRPPAYAALGVGLVAALVLGLTRLGARLVVAAAAPFGGGWRARVLAGGLAVSVLTRAVTLPLDARAEVQLRRFGLSTQTWGSWLGDQAKGLALTTGLLLVALLALYALIRRWPASWWAPAALGGAGLVVAVSFVFPLVVEPAFNRFEAMPPGDLRDSLLQLAERDGVPVRDVLVADASRRTTALNAYVSGFGSTRRVVVYDTLLRGATPDEVRLIVAHELGHAERGDVLRGTLLGALGTAAAVCLLGVLLQSGRLLRRAGVTELRDPASLALVLALVAALTALGGPVQLLVSRHVEARADAHALDLTGDPATFAAMQRRLAVRNLSDLDPPRLVHLLFATHPTAPERIAMARAWARRADVAEPPGLAP